VSEEYNNVVDLNAFREQKLREEAEKERLEKDQQVAEDIEYMRYLLVNIMQNIGDPTKTGSIFYVPMSDNDYFTQYQFDSGYDDQGDWYSSWESEDFNEEDYFQEPDED
tara:strand:+ start:185 stop:511 length:327 start_codon:yes stop_codon:yes gene_type:complete